MLRIYINNYMMLFALNLFYPYLWLCRQGSPRKRKGPISGTKGTDRFRSEEPFYVNPLPDCLCHKDDVNSSLIN